MDKKDIISIQKFCKLYEVPVSFVDSLYSFQLIDIVDFENTKHIHTNQIAHIEKLIRLHYDLNINFEGLDVINNLLDKINELENEVISLKRQISFYK